MIFDKFYWNKNENFGKKIFFKLSKNIKNLNRSKTQQMVIYQVILDWIWIIIVMDY